MKNLKYPLIAFVLCILYLPDTMAQDSTANKSILVVINGVIASNEALKKIPEDEIKSMHYLSSRDARQLYGMAGAHGALLVKTEKEKRKQPVILREKNNIPVDSLEENSFTRIDVIRGRQALNLYGPAGKDGVLIMHSPDERIDALLEVVDVKGKPLSGAEIKNEAGEIIAVSNDCGMAYLEKLIPENNLSISHKKYHSKNVNIENKKVKIVLEK